MGGISPVNAEIKLDLTEPVKNIVNTALTPFQYSGKGILKIISACTGKWFANRDRQIALITAQTEKDIEDIKSGKKVNRYGELIPADIAPTPQEFYNLISDYNRECDAKRLGAAMLEAALILSSISDDKISDEPLNQTFFNHWRKEAELIDDNDLRAFWAKLLVEETCRPNSVNPRTLDVARNLSKEEAKTFEKICQCIFLDTVPVNDKIYPLNGTYKEALLLQEAGLLGQASNVHTEAAEKGTFFIAIMNGGFILKADTNRIAVNCYPLTVAGQQIAKIISVTPDVSVAKKIAREVSGQNHNIPIYLLEKQDGDPDDQTPAIWDTTQPD